MCLLYSISSIMKPFYAVPPCLPEYQELQTRLKNSVLMKCHNFQTSALYRIWGISARFEENMANCTFATHYFTNSSISFNCRIIISGASGGVSRINKVQSKADQIRALVHLVVNETLFIISGQMGSSVCQGFGEVSL